VHSKNYSQHLRDAKYCGLQWRILFLKPDYNEQHSTDFKQIRVIRERCNSKACPHCAKRNFNRIRNRLREKSVTIQWRFFTLTSRNDSKSSEAKLEKLENDFRQLRKHLKRKFPNFQYIAIKELSPSGMWHYHGLWNIYIDIRELSEIWEKYSSACVVYLEKVRKPIGAINYIFKYCYKSIFNSDELRTLYECDKKKFTTSRGLLNQCKIENPYTCELGTTYDVSELKKKLYDIVVHSQYTVNDFYSIEYPYFEDLIFNLFYELLNEHPPNLFEQNRLEFVN
jgi:hypothetical protein